MKARQGRAVAWPLLLASLAAMILGCAGFSALLDGGAAQCTSTPSLMATAAFASPTATQLPGPTATPRLVPEGGWLLAPGEFRAPVDVVAQWEDLPSGELMVWWKPVEAEGLTRVGYVTFDGKAGDILSVGDVQAKVIGVGGVAGIFWPLRRANSWGTRRST